MEKSFIRFDLTGYTSMDTAIDRVHPYQLLKADCEAVIRDDNGVIQARIPSKYACTVIRSDGLELGAVSKTYNLLTAHDLASNFQPVIDTGMVDLIAGGTADYGTIVWFQSKLKDAVAEVLKGDEVRGNPLMSTGFIGNQTTKIGMPITRVVCRNMLEMAMRECINSIRHTKNMQDRIEEAKLQILGLLEGFRDTVEAYKSIAAKKCTKQQFETYACHVLDIETKKEDRSTRASNILKTVSDLFEGQKSYEYVPAARGTYWGGYNAVTQYLTHEYGRSEDSRATSNWFGPAAAINRKALDYAIEVH